MKKTILILSIFLAILFIIPVLIHLVAPQKLEIIIRDEINKALEHNNTSYHNTEVRDLGFSLLFTRLKIKEITIEPVSADSPGDYSDFPKLLIKAQVRNLEISTSGLIALYRGKTDINFNSLGLQNLSARVVYNPMGTGEEKPDSDFKIETISFGKINIENFDAEAYTTDGSSLVASMAGATLETGVSITFDKHNSPPVFEITNSRFLTDRIMYYHELYTFTIDNISFDNNIMKFGHLEADPVYGKAEFSNHINWETDRFEFVSRSITIRDIDLSEIINNRKVIISSIEINGGVIDIYRDKNLPFDNTRRPLMPSRLIHTLPYEIEIMHFHAKDLDIYYSEVPQGGHEPGTIPFRNLEANISNITNNKEKLFTDSIMLIKAKAKSVGGATLEAEFKYNLMDINGGFIVTGSLEQLNFEDLNPIIYPLAGVEAGSGVHHKSEFSFSGNDASASGTLKMAYSDLEVILEPGRSRLRQEIVSWAGERFIYHTSNPPGDDTRTADIDFERDTSRFVFNYWWNCYFSGIKNTVIR